MAANPFSLNKSLCIKIILLFYYYCFKRVSQVFFPAISNQCENSRLKKLLL